MRRAWSRVAPSDYAWAKNLIEHVDGREYVLRRKERLSVATCG